MSATCAVAAHRGASSVAPENTLEAVEAAAAEGITMIECDVHLTKDGEVVVIHDTTVDRTTDGIGAVSELTLDELSKLNANYNKKEFKHCKIPTFEEWLALVLKHNKIPLIELKRGRKGIYKGLVAKLYEICRKHKCHTEAIFQSFNLEYLEELRALDPNIQLHSLYKLPQIDFNLIERNKKVGISSINVYHMTATKAFCLAMHNHGFKVMVYTVDVPGRMLRLISNGVDGIITNKPDLLVNLLKDPEKYANQMDHTWTIVAVAAVFGVSVLAFWLARTAITDKGKRGE